MGLMVAGLSSSMRADEPAPPAAKVDPAAGSTNDAPPADPATEGDGWVSLFDGKTLDGWKQRNGTATYKVENGTVVGRTTEGSPNSFSRHDQRLPRLRIGVRCER